MALRTKKSEKILPFALRGARKSYRSHQKENRTVGREYCFFEDKQRENHSDQRREEREERESILGISSVNWKMWAFGFSEKLRNFGFWVSYFRFWVFGFSISDYGYLGSLRFGILFGDEDDKNGKRHDFGSNITTHSQGISFGFPSKSFAFYFSILFCLIRVSTLV